MQELTGGWIQKSQNQPTKQKERKTSHQRTLFIFNWAFHRYQPSAQRHCKPATRWPLTYKRVSFPWNVIASIYILNDLLHFEYVCNNGPSLSCTGKCGVWPYISWESLAERDTRNYCDYITSCFSHFQRILSLYLCRNTFEHRWEHIYHNALAHRRICGYCVCDKKILF